MTELRRLFDAQADEFAIELLRAAEDDAPGPRSLAQTAAALGVGAMLGGAATLSTPLASGAGSSLAASPGAAALAATPAAAGLAGIPGAASSVAAISLAVLAKHAALGMAAGLVVMGGFYSTIGAPRQTADGPSARAAEAALAAPPMARRATASGGLPSERGVAAELAAAPLVAPAQVAPAQVEETPLVESGSLPENTGDHPVGSQSSGARVPGTRRLAAAKATFQPEKQPSDAVSTNAVAAAATVASAQPKNASLALEVELLDRARGALLAGDAIGSLSVLDEYQSAQRSGILAPEAQVLRIQVLERLGRTGAASALARDFVERHPGSRHAAALRPLAERADASP